MEGESVQRDEAGDGDRGVAAGSVPAPPWPHVTRRTAGSLCKEPVVPACGWRLPLGLAKLGESLGNALYSLSPDVSCSLCLAQRRGRAKGGAGKRSANRPKVSSGSEGEGEGKKKIPKLVGRRSYHSN